MIINISDFLSNDSEQIFKQEGNINLGQIDQDVRILDDADYSLLISKVDHELFISIDVNFKYEKPCDRCLCKTIFEDNINYSAEILDKEFINVNDEDENLEDYVEMSNNQVDLGELIRQLIILAIPMKTLCDEECKGICPICGQDLNEGDCNCEQETGDPRFSVLRNLVIDEEV